MLNACHHFMMGEGEMSSSLQSMITLFLKSVWKICSEDHFCGWNSSYLLQWIASFQIHTAGIRWGCMVDKGELGRGGGNNSVALQFKKKLLNSFTLTEPVDWKTQLTGRENVPNSSIERLSRSTMGCHHGRIQGIIITKGIQLRLWPQMRRPSSLTLRVVR